VYFILQSCRSGKTRQKWWYMFICTVSYCMLLLFVFRFLMGRKRGRRV